MGALETLVATFGPFLVPAALFVAGVVVYTALVAVSRWRA